MPFYAPSAGSNALAFNYVHTNTLVFLLFLLSDILTFARAAGSRAFLCNRYSCATDGIPCIYDLELLGRSAEVALRRVIDISSKQIVTGS